jgi:broad specificity phosphatase PhoE
MVTITYFVHGTTPDNENGLATGWLPGELSPLGLEQAKVLAKQVADREFDIIICSDLYRAVQTAQLLFGDKHPIIQDDRLREANYGDWNGKPHHFKNNMEDFVHEPFPNGESYRDVEARMQSLCDELREKYPGKRVVLLAHQAPQLALDVIVKGKNWEQAIAEDWRRTKAYQPGWEYVLAD